MYIYYTGLTSLEKCYPVLIENLPSNLLTTLLRLLDVANIPEKVIDTIVQSSCAEVGNKMIINYLIGLVHTEEHIITFCNFVERMLGEFEKCYCVLNLRNSKPLILHMNDYKLFLFSTDIALLQPSKENAIVVTDSSSSTDISDSIVLLEKGADSKHGSTEKCEADVSMIHITNLHI